MIGVLLFLVYYSHMNTDNTKINLTFYIIKFCSLDIQDGVDEGTPVLGLISAGFARV
jgi:hypothetical protein